MIKSNEFRLGNLIYFGGEIDAITAISKGSLSFKSGFAMFIANEFEPILLTKEWLLKAGFEDKYSNNWFKKNELGIYYTFDLLSFKTCVWTFDIKYIHQLQNIYFALTGEELIFNL